MSNRDVDPVEATPPESRPAPPERQPKDVLLVKTSSLGDVVHAMYAVAEAKRMRPELRFHWVVEEGFSELPGLHPDVTAVMPIAIRRWRRHWLASRHEVRAFVRSLRERSWDLVLDSQGLLKSGIVAALANGPVGGYARDSAREPLVSWLYDTRATVAKDQHAVDRQRRLFSRILGYGLPAGPCASGLEAARAGQTLARQVVFLHATTWSSKAYPAAAWRQLAALAASAGYEVLLPWGNPAEGETADAIAADIDGVRRLPAQSLAELADLMARSAGVVAVDTGLGHLAGAMGVPLVGLFGPTDPVRTGFYGLEQTVPDHLACIPCLRRECRYSPLDYEGRIYPPCFDSQSPAAVWTQLLSRMDRAP